MKNTFNDSQTITSRDQIEEIYNIFLKNRPAHIRYSGQNIKVKCSDCINGKVVIDIPFETDLPDPVIVHSSLENKTIHLYLKKAGKANFDNTIFDITKCNLIVSARGSSRHRISHDKDHKKVVYITDFITDTIVGNSILSESNKLSAIFNRAETELLKTFSTVRFMTKNEGQHDIRMQYISKRGKGIIIRKIDDPNPDDKEGYDFYMKNIFLVEKPVKMRKLSFSEAVLPLYYRDKIPYGYLKVAKDSNLNDSDLKLAEKYVKSIEQYLHKLDIFPVVPDKIIVHEVSSAGLSVLQHEKKNSRHFKIGSQFCYDLVIPDNKKVHLLARIKHNSPGGNGIIRTGFEIEKIDENHIEDFKAYLGSFA